MHAIDSHPRARLTSSASPSFREFVRVFIENHGETFASGHASSQVSIRCFRKRAPPIDSSTMGVRRARRAKRNSAATAFPVQSAKPAGPMSPAFVSGCCLYLAEAPRARLSLRIIRPLYTYIVR
ncbi:hypothetical protein [Burkholderia sp. FL-7-2-10-S1-D7]|uniref:hypothetical protein n=1 Tax=Burkholderia sp. FL-7-2-10-S1-D7 TaxID=1637866 RepID=UPI0012E3D609|nr:hypothetical protein [Burkholderia sp. FL-7-2-10-S1-D7]